MIKKEIKYKGSEIAYFTEGEGPVVMLVHGFGEDHRIWENLVEDLQHSFKMICPDLPGSGSSALLKMEDVGIHEYAICVKDILDAEQVDACCVIGHSMGGYITMDFAKTFPEKLVAFGLIHSSAFADDEEKKGKREKGIAFIDKKGAHAFLKTMIPDLFYDQQARKKEVGQLVERGKAFSDHALVQYYKAMKDRKDTTLVLKNSTVPVLFVLGEHDKAIPYEQALAQTHMANCSYIHTLRHSAHMGMLEEKNKFNKILKHFLEDAFHSND